MLTLDNIKTAIILCKRASLTGEESLSAAQAILALEDEYTRIAEAQKAKATKRPAGKKKPRGQPK